MYNIIELLTIHEFINPGDLIFTEANGQGECKIIMMSN